VVEVTEDYQVLFNCLWFDLASPFVDD
jgi:hypothetical protein